MKFPIPKSLWLYLSVLTISPYTNAAIAADEDSIYKFNAFGTFGLTHSSEKRADFAAVITRPSGAGFSSDWSPEVDSKIGGQISANFDSHWSAVLQVVAEQNWDNSHTPHIEWANVKYAFTPDFSVRAGRVALPIYLFSDSKVGYVLPAVRPGMYFYSLAPFTHSDGVDSSYRFGIGQASNTVTALAGKLTFKQADRTSEGNKFELPREYALVDKLEIGDLTLQASYFVTHVNAPKIIAIPNPALSRLGDHAAYKIKLIGFNYSPGNFYILGEAGKDDAPFLGTREGWYLSGGYRLGKFTPYLKYEKNKQSKPGPGFLQPTDLNTSSIGVRWDFMKNVDFKVQFDHTNLGAGAVGPLLNLQSGFQAGKSFNLTSFNLDFVF